MAINSTILGRNPMTRNLACYNYGSKRAVDTTEGPTTTPKPPTCYKQTEESKRKRKNFLHFIKVTITLIPKQTRKE